MLQPPSLALLGVDFTCAPSRRKPITVAWGQRRGDVVRLEALQAVHSLAHFEALLCSTQEHAAHGWLGAFDFPFGLPRVFTDALAHAPPTSWHGGDIINSSATNTAQHAPAEQLIKQLHKHCGTRQGFQQLIDAWGVHWGIGSRPPRLPHRRTDTAMAGISSTSPLQTRYVPVGKMYFEGLHRLVLADITLPGLRTASMHNGPAHKLAVEAYPGLLAKEILQGASYKSDLKVGPSNSAPNLAPNSESRRKSDARLLQRLTLIDALEQGRTWLGLRLKLSPAQRDHLASDPQGDRLDAALCLLQAGWAHRHWSQGDPLCGLPADIDPLEGWIISA